MFTINLIQSCFKTKFYYSLNFPTILLRVLLENSFQVVFFSGLVMKKKGKFLNLKEHYFMLQIIKKSAKVLFPISLEEYCVTGLVVRRVKKEQ